MVRHPIPLISTPSPLPIDILTIDVPYYPYLSLGEQQKLKEATIDELKKQITQWEGKLRQQQQVCIE